MNRDDKPVDGGCGGEGPKLSAQQLRRKLGWPEPRQSAREQLREARDEWRNSFRWEPPLGSPDACLEQAIDRLLAEPEHGANRPGQGAREPAPQQSAPKLLVESRWMGETKAAENEPKPKQSARAQLAAAVFQYDRVGGAGVTAPLDLIRAARRLLAEPEPVSREAYDERLKGWAATTKLLEQEVAAHAKTRAEVEQMIAHHDERTARIAELEAEVKSAVDRLSEREGECRGKARTIAELEAEAEQAWGRVTQAERHEIPGLIAEVERLRDNLCQAVSRETYLRDLDEAQKRLWTERDAHAKTRAELEQTRADREACVRTVINTDRAWRTYREQQGPRVAELEAEVERLKQRNAGYEAESEHGVEPQKSARAQLQDAVNLHGSWMTRHGVATGHWRDVLAAARRVLAAPVPRAESVPMRPNVTRLDDGSTVVEWTGEDARFGVSIEANQTESGWYSVSRDSAHSGPVPMPPVPMAMTDAERELCDWVREAGLRGNGTWQDAPGLIRDSVLAENADAVRSERHPAPKPRTPGEVLDDLECLLGANGHHDAVYGGMLEELRRLLDAKGGGQ